MVLQYYCVCIHEALKRRASTGRTRTPPLKVVFTPFMCFHPNKLGQGEVWTPRFKTMDSA